jgi:hypothetical protein
MATRETTYQLRFGHIGRDAEEEWQVIEPLMIQYWTAAEGCLSEKTYEHQGCTVRVLVDWAPYAGRMARDHQIMAAVLTGQWRGGDWYAKVSKPLRLQAVCTVTGKNNLSDYPWYPGFFLEYFLYEVFAIANLACPGSANFYSLSIEGKATRSRDEPRLSSFYFEEWMIESIQGKDPVAHILTPEAVFGWLAAVSPRVTQKGETGTQRSLFALYQLCKSDGQVVDVLWIFNALESLLSTKVGENFSGLVRRAALVLGLNASQTSAMSKKLRKLYDLRSSFVHGGYDVAHPIHSETIDRRLELQYEEVFVGTKYGFSLLAALLQRMIATNRTAFSFEERLIENEAAP